MADNEAAWLDGLGRALWSVAPLIVVTLFLTGLPPRRPLTSAD